MKRYELMSPKQVLDTYGSAKFCSTCILTEKKRYCSAVDCVSDITDYLNEELEIVKRWKRIKCDDDLVTLYNDYINKAKSPTAYGFVTFLLEGIPEFEER